MKKRLFYLFALICSMGLFTACSDDETETKEEMTLEQVITTELAGTYDGTLGIIVNGQSLGSMEQSIILSKSSSADNSLKLELKNFEFILPTPFDITVDPFDITVDPCAVTESNGTYTFAGSQEVAVGMLGNLPVKVSGTIKGDNITIDITVDATALLGQTVNVSFEGTQTK